MADHFGIREQCTWSCAGLSSLTSLVCIAVRVSALRTLKNRCSGYLSPRFLHSLLTLSVLTNLVFAVRVYYPDAMSSLRSAMTSPPTVMSTDHVRGNSDAKVSVIVYTDFQCTYCARLHASMHTLVGETDIRWVNRHFPLESHLQAANAAEAAECAGVQGKFWEYSDALFESARKLEGDTRLTRIASGLGLDTKVFAACLSSRQFSSRVSAQRQDGRNRNITGTPTFFVNGRRYSGVIPIDQLKSVLIKSAG